MTPVQERKKILRRIGVINTMIDRLLLERARAEERLLKVERRIGQRGEHPATAVVDWPKPKEATG